MRPELVMLEGDNEIDDIELSHYGLEYFNRYHPELMGQLVTGAKLGAIVGKGFARLFKRVGKKRRKRVDKWKNKIRKERAQKMEQLKFEQMRQQYKEQQSPPPAFPGQTMNLQKLAIPAIIGIAVLMMLKK